MKTLEGQAALSYFHRLVPAMEVSAGYTIKILQGHLLLAILTIDKALFESLPEEKDLAAVVTPNGFPLLDLSLSHVKQALKLQFANVDQKRLIASDLLLGVANISEEQINLNLNKLSDAENKYPAIAKAFSGLKTAQINFLETLCQNPNDKRLSPFSTSLEFPGVLLTNTIETPFYKLTEKEQADSKPWWYRKYIDGSPQYTTSNLIKSSPQNPIAKEAAGLDSHPRFPIVITGGLDNNGRPRRLDKEKDTISTPRIPVYHRLREPGAAPEVKLVNYISLTEQAIDKIASLANSSLKTSFLSIDFSSLSDDTIDTIIAVLPKIDEQLAALVAMADLAASNQPFDTGRFTAKSKELFATLGQINDVAARQSIQLAFGEIVPKKDQPNSLMEKVISKFK